MATTAGSTPSPGEALRIAGRPAAHWAYALRIWLAMLAALLIAFWLQLDGGGGAVITVAILSQPMRGQVLAKSLHRMLGTLAGFVASIVIVALFAQARDLYVLAYSLWVAGCVYRGSLSEGTRAYAFVLAGYTVALVVVAYPDHPQAVFAADVAHLAVVGVGIASVALVDALLTTPEVYPKIRDRLGDALAEVRSLVEAMARGERDAARESAAADGVVGVRPDILALPTERAVGMQHAGAARSAAAAMIGALGVARLAARTEALAPPRAEDRVPPDRAVPTALRQEALIHLRLARMELAAMKAGGPPSRRVHLPHHRSREEALRKAARVFLAVAGSSILLIYSGWPDAAQALTQVIVLGCLAMTVPDDREFAKVCLIAMPLAAVIGGLTKFLLLGIALHGGGEGFPMLALGLAPGVFLCCLMFCHPTTSQVGYLTLIYVAVFVGPSDPQTYDPQTFLTLALLYNVGVVLLSAALAVFIPTTARDQRRWLLRGIARDLCNALSGRAGDAPEALAYRCADRITRLGQVELGSDAARRRRVVRAWLLADVALAAAQARAALGGTQFTARARARDAAVAAIAALDAAGLDAAARALGAAPPSAMAAPAAPYLRALALLAAAPPPALRRAVRTSSGRRAAGQGKGR